MKTPIVPNWNLVRVELDVSKPKTEKQIFEFERPFFIIGAENILINIDAPLKYAFHMQSAHFCGTTVRNEVDAPLQFGVVNGHNNVYETGKIGLNLQYLAFARNSNLREKRLSISLQDTCTLFDKFDFFFSSVLVAEYIG